MMRRGPQRAVEEKGGIAGLLGAPLSAGWATRAAGAAALPLNSLAMRPIGAIMPRDETTAIALTWALFLVANAPDVERKLLDEVASVAGDGPITPENAEKLVYAKQVVQEAMRLFPPAPLIGFCASSKRGSCRYPL